MKTKRVPRSVDEVLDWLEEKHKNLMVDVEVEKHWVWLKSDLRGCGRKKCDCDVCTSKRSLREELKEFGFAFKFNGDHVLPSGETARWAHSASSPTRFKRTGKRDTETKTELSDEELLAALKG